MNFLIEYSLLSIVIITLVFMGQVKKRKRVIVPVNNLRHMCKSETDTMLYDELMKHGVYVRPSLELGSCLIPIALEQYQIAIFTETVQRRRFVRRLKLKVKEIYLRSSGWRVLNFTKQIIDNEIEVVFQTISKEMRTTKQIKA